MPIDEYALQQQLPLDEATHQKHGVTRWRHCPNCGKLVQVTAARCGWCGQYLLRHQQQDISNNRTGERLPQ